MRRVSMAAFSALGVLLIVCFGASAQQSPSAANQLPPSDTACKISPVDAAHLFVVAGAMEGDTLTSLQLDDPNGRSTVIRVKVEQGAQPITAFLHSGSPVIWDFEGAVQRMHRVVVASSDRRRRVAVRGLSAQQVEFPELARCGRAIDPPWDDAGGRLSKGFAAHFGRAPDRIVFEAEPNSLSLPEAVFALTRRGAPAGMVILRGPDANAERDLLISYPGGFRAIEAASLVSPVAVLAPETPPGEAGLIQLEKAGVIRRVQRAEIDAFIDGVSRPYRSKLSPDYRMTVSFDYAVTGDAMLPASLFGAHSKNFLVLAGVPAPRGNAGHGCVALMDGFRMSDSTLCFGEMRESIERLSSLPPPDRLEACRLLSVPSGATLEAVSAYEPEGAKHSHGSKRIPGAISVRVRKPGAIALVLNTYEPAIWNVSFSPETRIVAVILTGYYTSSVEGVHPDTPTINVDWQGRQNRPAAAPGCAPVSGYLGTAYRGGPAAMLLDRQIQALTGHNIASLRGAYKLKEVVIP